VLVTDAIIHSLVFCKQAKNAFELLHGWVNRLCPGENMSDVLYLQTNCKGDIEHAISWITIITLHYIWKNRDIGGLTVIVLRAEIIGAMTAIKRKFEAVWELVRRAVSE
jgi:hypothetical protein